MTFPRFFHLYLTLSASCLLFSCQSNQDKALALQQQAKERMQAGAHQEAVSLLDESLQLQEGSADTYNLRGVAHLNLQAYGKAITDLNRAIALDSSQYKFFYNRGNVRRNLQDQKGARQDYDRAARLDSSQYEIYLNRAFTFAAEQQLPAALQDFDRAERLSAGKDALVFLHRGRIRMLGMDFAGAEADFEKALALDPKMGAAYYHLALAKTAQVGKADEGVCKLLQQASKLGVAEAEQALRTYCAAP